MSAIQGLWNAVELGVVVTFVIVNNRTYQALNDFGRQLGLNDLPGTQLPHLDFCALAASQCVETIAVERAAELDAALATVFSASRAMLLEVRVEAAEG